MGIKTPELLAPAGDLERLRMAVLYGADAVYLAGADFGMRAFAGNFSPEGLTEAVSFAHAHGVRVHCTVNTMPRNEEMDRLPAHLERLEAAGVDAVILADLGAFQLAGRYAPHAARHVSTQAGVTNYEAARAWHDLGASRVILARELSLEEIREMESCRNIPVVMLTSRSDKETIIKSSKLGVYDYVLKPFKKQDLLERIDRVLKQLS